MGIEKPKYRRLMKLEAIRGLSALYVFIHHYVHGNPELAFMKKFFIFGQFALMIFFVLSGFVIYYATVYRKPDMGFGEFLFRRFRRIFPALIVVLLLTYVFRCFTSMQLLDFHFLEFLGNLVQLQDKNPASWFDPYWQNAPLWSLAYEWWFYMFFFAIWRFTRNRSAQQKYIVMSLSLFGFLSYWFYPNQFSLFLSYFILWWSGLELAREWTETGKISLRKQFPMWGSILGMTIVWGIPAYLAYHNQLYDVLTQFPFQQADVMAWLKEEDSLVLAYFPFVQPRHFLTVFLVLIGGYIWYKLRWFIFDRLLSPFIILAPISYVVYIFHYPVIYLARVQRPFGNVWLDLLWVIPTVFVISWLVEQPFQKWVVSWMKWKGKK